MTMRTTTETRRGMPPATTRVQVSGGDELDVWVSGDGDPVVFVHGGLMRDFLEPLAGDLVGRDGYRTILFGRRGHGGVGLPGEPTDIPGQASDVVAILDALGIDRAHVAGHSFGALIVLELATRVPERLRSAILLEAPLVQTEAFQQALPAQQEAMSLIAAAATSGDADGAVARFWDFTAEIEDAADVVEPALPEGARAMAASDLDTWLQVDLPAMASWIADPAAVTACATPIVWIGATGSPPLFQESRALFQEWMPSIRTAEIAGAGHYFPVLKPAETAAALDELLRRTSRGRRGHRRPRVPG
jgi:pimeloyl-ACP methyl ester carboxylesterase